MRQARKLRVSVRPGLKILGRGVCAGLALLLSALLALPVGEAVAGSADHRDTPRPWQAMGGPFSLIDHTGQRVTDQDFRGEFLLLYFGYTYCADICPTDLQTMTTALDLLGPAGERVRPIFITVDPKRDTVAQLGEYVALFHPRLVGLTGTTEEIRSVANAYRVPYRNSEVDGEVVVDHTGHIYLVGPDGGLYALFTYGTSAEDMAARIAVVLEGINFALAR